MDGTFMNNTIELGPSLVSRLFCSLRSAIDLRQWSSCTLSSEGGGGGGIGLDLP